MYTQFQLLRLIADGNNYSNRSLAQRLGISTIALKKSLCILESYGLSIINIPKNMLCLSPKIDLLDKQYLLSTLSPHSIKNLSVLHIFYVLDSTNQYLLENANSLEQQGTIVLAEYQTNGRGRYGRQWISPFGSGINLSIKWHFLHRLSPLLLRYLPLAVGSVTIQALQNMGLKEIKLKWPNDIFYHNKKLGGVLIETKGKAGETYDVVIGLGLNVSLPVDFQDAIKQPCIDLANIMPSMPSRNQICAQIIDEIISLLDNYQESRDEDIINQWQSYSLMQQHAKLSS